MENESRITELLELVTYRVCKEICKYTDAAKTDEELDELLETKCKDCPLNLI